MIPFYYSFNLASTIHLLHIYYMPDFSLGAGETARNNSEKVWSILLGNPFLLLFFCYFLICIYCQSLLFYPIVIIFITLLCTFLHFKHYYKNARLIEKRIRIKESENSGSQQQAYNTLSFQLIFLQSSLY